MGREPFGRPARGTTRGFHWGFRRVRHRAESNERCLVGVAPDLPPVEVPFCSSSSRKMG